MDKNNVNKGFRSITILLWALNCPVTSLGNNIYGLYPWPSITIQALLLLCILLLTKSNRTKVSRIDKKIPQLLSLISVAVLLTRFQVGMLLIPVIYFVLKYYHFNLEKEFQRNKLYLKSLIQLLLGVSFIGILNNSFRSFIDQIIIGPLGIYTTNMNWTLFFGLLKIGVPLGLIILSIYAIEKYVLSKNWEYFLYAVAILIVILIQLQVLTRNESILQHLPININEFFSNQQLNFLSIGYLVAFMALPLMLLEFVGISKYNRFFSRETVISSKHIKSLPNTRETEVRLMEITNLGTITILSMPSILLLYPLPSQYHFWWSSPTVFLIISCTLRIKKFGREIKKYIFIVILIPTLVSLLNFWNHALERELVSLDSGIFENMKIDPIYLRSYEEMNIFMSQKSQANMSSICFDALFLSWDGNFNSNGPKVVSWAFGLSHSNSATYPSRTLLCSDDVFAQNFASVNKVRLISELDYKFSWWSQGKIFEYETIK
jgi:hypothetical protein